MASGASSKASQTPPVNTASSHQAHGWNAICMKANGISAQRYSVARSADSGRNHRRMYR